MELLIQQHLLTEYVLILTVTIQPVDQLVEVIEEEVQYLKTFVQTVITQEAIMTEPVVQPLLQEKTQILKRFSQEK
jgi:hypothetical protein